MDIVISIPIYIYYILTLERFFFGTFNTSLCNMKLWIVRLDLNIKKTVLSYIESTNKHDVRENCKNGYHNDFDE